MLIFGITGPSGAGKGVVSDILASHGVKIIDAEWNFVEDIDNIYHSLPKTLLDEYERSEKNPKIIHYPLPPSVQSVLLLQKVSLQ